MIEFTDILFLKHFTHRLTAWVNNWFTLFGN